MKGTLKAPVISILPQIQWPMMSITTLKEIRVAGAPAFWGIVLLILGAIFLRQPLGISGIAIHSITCSAIAAIVAGQDFLYRTAPWNMALPAPRTEVWRRRMMIAGLAMLPVTLVGFITVWLDVFSGRQIYVPPSAWRYFSFRLLEPAVTSICLAPWLTLVSRSPLFGTVFSIGTMFLVFIFSSTVFRIFGFDEPEQAAGIFSMWAMPCIWIFGAVMGWRKFMTLEIIEPGGGKVLEMARGSVVQGVKCSSPTWQLLKKEIMLQRFPVVLAIFSMGLVFLMNKEQAALWTLVYPAALVIIMASVSSAAERQMGTIEWQALLPISFWKQWLLKFFVTFFLAAVLGVALPVLLLRYKTDELRSVQGIDMLTLAMVFAASLFMFVVITMYVSSLCSSGIKAVLSALWINVAAAYLIIQSFEAHASFLWVQDLPDQRNIAWDAVEWWFDVRYWPFLLSILGLVAMAMIFAMRNHRSAERGNLRVVRQLLGFASYQAVVTLATYIFWSWYTWLY